MAVLRCARIGYHLDKHIPQATRIPQKHALGLGPGVGTGFVKKTGFVEITRALKTARFLSKSVTYDDISAQLLMSAANTPFI
jgi:hypothetical protein